MDKPSKDYLAIDCIDIRFEGTEPERLKAIQASAASLVDRMMTKSGDDCVWSLAESLWPALTMPEYTNTPIKKITLRLVSLSRIGQMEGKSGSLVLIGFLADTDDEERPHSHPVVVKTLSVENHNKLREEYDSALSIKTFAYDQKDNFAIPIYFDDSQQGYYVLWSIFSPSDPIWPVGASSSATSAFKVNDLRKPLEMGNNDIASPILSTTFRLLRNLHYRLNKSHLEERSFGEEYERYLRKLDEKIWGSEWEEAWGPSDTRHIQDAGGQFANPFWVLEQVKPLRKPMYIGAVHGDLHPGNIVLTGEQPRIIDFGWAKDGAHIAKDIVLMECNLRFHTVRPQLNQREAHALSDWVAWGASVPEGLGDYSRGRAELIEHLRKIAKKTFPQGTNWDWEYLVPLFLVAFGLLRFAPQLGNQQAAVRFVLALATHIEEFLNHGK